MNDATTNEPAVSDNAMELARYRTVLERRVMRSPAFARLSAEDQFQLRCIIRDANIEESTAQRKHTLRIGRALCRGENIARLARRMVVWLDDCADVVK